MSDNQLVLLREWAKKYRIHYKEALNFFNRYHPEHLQSFAGYYFVNESLTPQQIGLRRRKVVTLEKLAKAFGVSPVVLLRYAIAGYIPSSRYTIIERKGRVFIQFPNDPVEVLLAELIEHLKKAQFPFLNGGSEGNHIKKNGDWVTPDKVAKSLGINTAALLRYVLAGYVPNDRYTVVEKGIRVFVYFRNEPVESLAPALVRHLHEHGIGKLTFATA